MSHVKTAEDLLIIAAGKKALAELVSWGCFPSDPDTPAHALDGNIEPDPWSDEAWVEAQYQAHLLQEVYRLDAA